MPPDALALARSILEQWANSTIDGWVKAGLLTSPLADIDFQRRLPPQPARRFTLIPGAREMLTAVGRRYPLAIVSARDERTTLAFLRQFDLEALFVCVATALTCQHAKPYPDQIVWAAQRMGVPPSTCLMIGDTTVDVRAGRAAGAQTVGVLCGFGDEKELRRAGADVILPGTADLPALLACG